MKKAVAAAAMKTARNFSLFFLGIALSGFVLLILGIGAVAGFLCVVVCLPAFSLSVGFRIVGFQLFQFYDPKNRKQVDGKPQIPDPKISDFDTSKVQTGSSSGGSSGNKSNYN